MVSLAQMTRRRRRRLHGRDLRHRTTRACIGFGWPWWIAGAVRDARRRHRSPRSIGCDLGAHRGHLHDHDHARDRRRLLLLRAAELLAVQRPFSGFAGIRAADVSSASTGAIRALLLSLPGWSRRRAMPPCSTARARPSALALQAIRDNPPAHARARLRRHRAPASPPTSTPASSPALAGVLLVWFNGRISPGTVDVGAGDQRPGHRRDRRHAPSDRRLHRRASSSS